MTARARDRRPVGAALRLAPLVLALLTLGGCMRGCTSPRPPIHPNPNMDLQPKVRAQAESDFFYDGMTMRQPLEHTVARGELDHDPERYEGRTADGAFVAANPYGSGEALVARGAERYAIYCLPCHGATGDGKGMLFERAQVESGNLHDPRIVGLADGAIFDVITNGTGLMQGYRYPVPMADRWAIVAYLRTLQQGGS